MSELRSSTARSGNGWTVDVEDGVMTWVFRQGMDLEAFEAEAYPVYEELLAERDVETLVTVVELEEPFTREAFEVWERAALKASDAGVDRWALVADGAKALSLRGQIDVGELDVFATEERTEAFAWADAPGE